jgi:hypothetical protein
MASRRTVSFSESEGERSAAESDHGDALGRSIKEHESHHLKSMKAII